MAKVSGTMELMQVISSLRPIEEFIVEGDYETRENIIYHCTMDNDWELDIDISSSSNIYYLFVNDKMKARIGINCGNDDFYNDIVLSKW